MIGGGEKKNFLKGWKDLYKNCALDNFSFIYIWEYPGDITNDSF